MRFEWWYQKDNPITVKQFLKEKGISRRLLSKIKFDGGQISVNGKEENVNFHLKKEDNVSVLVPNEGKQTIIKGVDMPIDILYEDEHYIAVNKPFGVASIPSFNHPIYSMANRIKGYYEKQNYPNQVIHVVTRLDRDTTGVMLLAKHRFAHALLDEQLKKRQVHKQYVAIAQTPNSLFDEGYIEANIARVEDSIMIRRVGFGDDGQYALTQYCKVQTLKKANVYEVVLHTGRTHQIRVHFNYKKATLIGDDLYGAPMDTIMKRQALHCQQVTFYNAFTQQQVILQAKLSEDMQMYISQNA